MPFKYTLSLLQGMDSTVGTFELFRGSYIHFDFRSPHRAKQDINNLFIACFNFFHKFVKLFNKLTPTQYADPSALTSEDVSDHGAEEEEEETETKF